MAKASDSYDCPGREPRRRGLGIWYDNQTMVFRETRKPPSEILRTVLMLPSSRWTSDWTVDVRAQGMGNPGLSACRSETNFTRMVSTISSAHEEASGLRHGITQASRAVFSHRDLGAGRVSIWEPTDAVKGKRGYFCVVRWIRRQFI